MEGSAQPRGTFKPKKSGRGLRKSATAQLGPVARRLLLALLLEERRMRTGTPAQAQALANEGIPWNLSTMAAAVDALPTSTSRTLGLLEARRLICCWAKGSGNNRRVQHVKLSAQAVEVAEAEERHPGMTQTQYRKQMLRRYLDERDYLEDCMEY